MGEDAIGIQIFQLRPAEVITPFHKLGGAFSFWVIENPIAGRRIQEPSEASG